MFKKYVDSPFQKKDNYSLHRGRDIYKILFKSSNYTMFIIYTIIYKVKKIYKIGNNIKSVGEREISFSEIYKRVFCVLLFKLCAVRINVRLKLFYNSLLLIKNLF